MSTLDVSLTAYQPTYENGSYTFTKTKYKKDAAVNLTNINIDEGDSYAVNDYKDFSVDPVSYTHLDVYKRQAFDTSMSIPPTVSTISINE